MVFQENTVNEFSENGFTHVSGIIPPRAQKERPQVESIVRDIFL